MADICAPIRRPSVSYRSFADRPAGVSAVAVDYKPYRRRWKSVRKTCIPNGSKAMT